MRNTNDLIWGCSLFVIGIVTLILAGSGMIGIDLPDAAVRILGVIDLAAIPFLAYSSVKQFRKGKE